MIKRRVAFAAAGLLFILPALLRFLASDYNQFLIFNADLLMVPAVYDDLGRGGSLRAWHFPAAPYLLPDFLLYLPARVLPNYFLDAAAFMVLQLSATWFVWRWLVNVITEGRDRFGALIGFAWLMLFVTAQARPLAYGMASYIHFGTFVLGLAALALSIRFLRDNSVAAAWWFTAISGAAMVSDRWFAVWFVGPAGLAVAWWAFRNPEIRHRAAVWTGASALSAAGSLVVHRWVLVHDNATPVSVEFRGPGLLRDGVQVIVDEIDISMWAALVVGVALVVVLAVLSNPRWRPGSLSAEMSALLAISTAVTLPAILVAQVLMSTTPDIRYLLPAYALPLLLLGPVLADLGTPGKAAMVLVPAVFAVGPALGAVSDVGTDRVDHVDCIDDALRDGGSRRGISTYWDAKPITVASELGLTIATVSPDLSTDPLNASADHYGKPYDFAIMSTWASPYTLEPAGVVPLAGEPQHVTTCGLYTVYDYGPGGLDWVQPPKP